MPPSWIVAYYSIDSLKFSIFETAITFKPLERFFQNLVANFEPTRAITRNVKIFKNPRWRPPAAILDFSLTVYSSLKGLAVVGVFIQFQNRH
jgi:hypothetical protein